MLIDLDSRLAWRNIPLADLLPANGTRDRLIMAGYTTAGKLLDTPADVLAAHVIGVGPVRAEQVRQRVFEAVQDLHDAYHAEPEPARWVSEDWPGDLDLVRLVPGGGLILVAFGAVALVGFALGLAIMGAR